MEEINKQGLLLWLKSLVESGRCPGVSWIDQDKGIFQIPWSNQKSRNWQKEDSRVFLEYAKQTGKYNPKNEKMDFPKWKQNLKSAINKNRFIVRMKEKDRLCGPKPYRVYQFLNETTARKRSSNKVSSVVNSLDEIRGFQSSMNAVEGVVVIENVFSQDRSMSTSSSVFSYSESEAPISPAPPVVLDYSLIPSPDIPRSDLYVQAQGNIPLLVDFFDENGHFAGGESHNSIAQTNESPLPAPHYVTDQTVHLTTIQEGVEGTQVDATNQEVLDTMMHLVETNSHKQFLFQPILVQTQPVELQPVTALRTMAVTAVSSNSDSVIGYEVNVQPSQVACNFFREMPVSQELDSLIPLPKSTIPADSTYLQTMANPTSVQQSEHASTVIACSTTSLQHCLSDKHTDDRFVQKAGQGIESALSINNTNNTAAVPCTKSSSFSELYDGCGSDLSFRMDTSESISSEKQRFTGFQFAKYINNTISTSISNVRLISQNNSLFTSNNSCVTQNNSAVTQNNSLVKPNNSFTTLHVPDDSVMHVQVLYGTPHRTVKKVKLTSSKNSCRLFFGSVNCSYMQSAMQGQQYAEEAELPAVDNLEYDDKTKNIIQKILKDFELGIVISYRDGDIYVERRCLPRVYLSDGVSKSESLPRSTVKRPDVETKAFDFNNSFKEAIELNQNNEGPVPKDHFILTVGYQILPNDDSPTRQVPVYIVVRHVMAAYLRFKILGASTVAPNPMLSDPNSFDKTVALFKDIDLKK